MSLYSPEEQSRIAVIRAKNEAGTATIDDFKEFVRICRQGRQTSLTSAATSRARAAKAAIPNANDLLDEMGAG